MSLIFKVKLGKKMIKKFPKVRQFRPKNPQKYFGTTHNIYARSMWEVKMMHWCDNEPSVIKWNSEDFVVPYYSKSEAKWRNYHIDFYIEYKSANGSIKKALIEIKPYCQTVAPKLGRRKSEQSYLKEKLAYQVNLDKWEAAWDYAQARGMEFLIFDEYDLGLKPIPKGGKK